MPLQVPMSDDICHDPWPSAVRTGSETLGIAGDSIMMSLTKNEARACLSDDDLNGLNYMHPSLPNPSSPSAVPAHLLP